MKTGNRARRDPAEGREASRVENRWPDTWEGTLDPTNLSTHRQRIANSARTKRGTALCSLHHVIDLDWMMEAYRLTRKDGAPGIDGVTAADYEVNLKANLLDLLERIRSGRYRAAGSPRVHSKSGRLAKKTRHSNVRRQGGATRRDNGAGEGLRTGLLALLVWLPARPLGSPGAPHAAERTLGQTPLLGARYRYTQVLRFDSALSPSNVPRPTSHGWCHPQDDR